MPNSSQLDKTGSVLGLDNLIQQKTAKELFKPAGACVIPEKIARNVAEMLL